MFKKIQSAWPRRNAREIDGQYTIQQMKKSCALDHAVVGQNTDYFAAVGKILACKKVRRRLGCVVRGNY